MAQTTSELWKSLWRTPNTEVEYGFDIDGTWYGPEQEVAHSVQSGIYEDFGIGNAHIAKLTLQLYANDVPKAAKIKRFARLKNGDLVSEWLPKGVFIANRRAEDDGFWIVEALDEMRKADVVWEPSQDLVFPLAMSAAAREMAAAMGVELDSRNVLNDSYSIDYPANEYTVRDILCSIAAAHGGNWVMTDAGTLRLLFAHEKPEETSYLVSGYGDAITFGGVRILV